MDQREQAKAKVESGMKTHGFSDARKMALGIWSDLSDRRDIKHSLDGIDYDVKEEILKAWEEIYIAVSTGAV